MADDQLAQPSVRHAMAGAKIIQQVFAYDAELRLQRTLGIIDAGMDHLTVAGAGLHADMVVLFQDDGVQPIQRQPARDRQPHRTGADDHRFSFKTFHLCFLPRKREAGNPVAYAPHL